LVGDTTRIRQVLLNLLGNAIKFTQRGQVELGVALHSQTADQACLHFSIRDTGIGISPEKQEMIFEAFSQADGSSTRKFGGTGLGLTISARLVELMQGKTWVESVLGEGSCFHFTAVLGASSEPRHHASLAAARRSTPAQ
jgi:two-component system sensor histidine kinase/response regulator